jgi:hypothetical protein
LDGSAEVEPAGRPRVADSGWGPNSSTEG